MKKIFLSAGLFCFIQNSIAQAPNSWTEKNAIGINVPSSTLMPPRMGAAGFNIGNKAYVGTGYDAYVYYNDFWEYDPAINAWTKKANFAGAARRHAVSFIIGGSGYIATGANLFTYYNDAWAYNPSTNVWTQKASLGLAREGAVAFSIPTIGGAFVGTGVINSAFLLNDFWFNQGGSWLPDQNFAGTSRRHATGFTIVTSYLGTGYDGIYRKDFWSYNGGWWTQVADFGGSERELATSFTIGNKGYVGTGFNGGYKNDFWEYNPSTNTWIQKANFGGGQRIGATSFSIGNKGYIGFGQFPSGYYGGAELEYGGCMNDLWEYDPVTDVWVQKTMNNESARSGAVGFCIGNKGYIGTGFNGSYKNDFWEFNPATNTWTQKANFGGSARQHATAFSIGSRGYIGTGVDGYNSYKNDFWEYNPVLNTWTQKANFGGAARTYATGFSIGNKGYIGTGYNNTVPKFKEDFWEYDPISDVWIQKSDFGGTPRYKATGFSIGTKGYIGTGDTAFASGTVNDFWEYDPVQNVWLQKANVGGTVRNSATGFNIGGYGYMGTGFNNNTYKNDFWEYNPASNVWTQRVNFGGVARRFATGIVVGNKAYIGSGFSGSHKNDFWEYTPLCSVPVSTIYSSGDISFCNGDSVFLYANTGYNYQWKKNGNNIAAATQYFYYAKTSGSYTCEISNTCDTIISIQINVTVNNLPNVTITAGGATAFCAGGSVTLNAVVAANRTYQWKKNGVNISGATSSSYAATTSGDYKVTVTNTITGCTKTSGTGILVTKLALPTATITPQGPTTFCAGQSVVLAANTGAGLTYKWKRNGNYISLATNANYIATTAGNYRVEVTNSSGCSKTSSSVTVTVPCREGENISEDEFNVIVSPNPSSGDFIFETQNAVTEKFSIDIYDMVGKLILSETIHNSTFIIHNLQLVPGIYSAVITTGEIKKVLKLVKTK